MQAVGRFFQLKERNSCFTQEMRGGFVTFLTVSLAAAHPASRTVCSLTTVPASARLPAHTQPPPPPLPDCLLLLVRLPWPAQVSYILAVNANIVTATGGMCVVDGDCEIGKSPEDHDGSKCQECITSLRASLISATAASCVVSHFLMGLLGNLPLAIAPAMGLNAYL